MSSASARAHVYADEIWHRFRDFVALRGVSLDIQQGEFVTLLGPSGSGKTTLLRIIAGLLYPSQGRVSIDGKDVTGLPAGKRNIGFVFQNYALFPHLTVFDNVAFPLRLRHAPNADIRAKVARVLDMVYLSGLDERHPSELSGGQQQRVALARAIVFNPTVLLMDEPLGSLDKRLRQQLQLEVRRLQKEVGITTVYVTHDQEEAFGMSDRIAVMNNGIIHQIGSPEEVYRSPVDTFVAHFVGDLNYFRGKLTPSNSEQGQLKTVDGLSLVVNLRGLETINGRDYVCGVRPEHVSVAASLDLDNTFKATLKTLTFQGMHYWAEVMLPSGRTVLAIVPQGTNLREGDEVQVGWNLDEARVFAHQDVGDEAPIHAGGMKG